ncbi:MAG: sugar phosphate isomerase/epimerase [Candidatus Methanomethylicota archaeon]|uniref:Sugar phosphate isomerase/epimerase n=1 Tax=Thermoproteota archaeon TaxID=2056631 RepID=A0A523BH24_9CREN|nr:MAG: sugar phosphate isomerase/epimerase [Candidatus Verstraetearchaeota archaeon]
MEIGISTLCTIGKTFKVIDELLSLKIALLEVLDEWKDRLTKTRVKALNELSASFPLKYTVHGPILDLNIASSNPRMRSCALNIIFESMSRAHEIGAKAYILHPGLRTPLDNLVPGVNRSLNLYSLEKILNYGEKIGLRVAVENMPGNTSCLLQRAEEFSALMDNGLPVYVALDVGHANTTSQLDAFLTGVNDRIVHLHLHDNCGTDDEHKVIGEGTVDWDLVRAKVNRERVSAVVENNNLEDAKKSFMRATQLFSS